MTQQLSLLDPAICHIISFELLRLTESDTICLYNIQALSIAKVTNRNIAAFPSFLTFF